MDLQNIIQEIKPILDNVVVVEFENGFAAAYERVRERIAKVDDHGRIIKYQRGNETSAVKFTVISEDGRPMWGGHNAYYLPRQEPTGFSHEAKETIDRYAQE